MIRYGDLELPHGALAELVVVLRRQGHAGVAHKLGSALDANIAELALKEPDCEAIVSALSKHPIPALSHLARVIEVRSARPRLNSQELDELREQRLAANEAFFRELNEKLEKLDRPAGDSDTLIIVCECADPDCIQRLKLTHREFETVRSDPIRFVVAHGHVDPEIEEVISRTERFELVQKIGVGREVASRLNSTSPTPSDVPRLDLAPSS